MNDNQSPTTSCTEPEPQARQGKTLGFAQYFWLSFLVVSLAYAGYCFYAPSNDIAWAASYEAAQEQAVEAERPVLLFFTGAWCSPCQIMKRQVWADEQVMAQVNATLVPVTMDVDDPGAAEALSRYGVGATPTTIITDSTGAVLQQRQGGMSKEEFLGMLAQLDSAAAEDL
jgi:protein disulfide-isomerase